MKNDFQNLNQSFSNVDFRRIAFKSLSLWYLFFIFIAIGVVWAFLKNRYATRTYPISASILFFGKDETSSGAELLYRNALVSTKRNYLNDPYLMKSNLIVKRVVEELSFNVQVILDGDISSSELYDLPFKIECPTFAQSGQYEFSVISDKKFKIDLVNKIQNISNSREFDFNTKFTFDGKEFLVSVIDQNQLLDYKSKLLRVVVNASNSIAENYSDQLILRWAEEGSGVMNMSVFGSTPQKEIDFINGVIKSYQRYDLDNKNRTADRTVEFIKSQLEIISDSLKQFEIQLERFKQDKHTNGDFNADAQRMFTRAEGFENQKATLLLRTSDYNYLKEYLEKEEDLNQVILPSSLELNDPILTGLIGKIMDIQLDAKLFLDKKTKGKSNPLIESKLERIANLKKEITESMNNQRNLDKIKIDYLSAQVKAIDKLFEAIPFNQRKLISITRKYTLYETLYLFLLQKKAEGEISRSGNASDLIVINPPRVTGGSITPSVFQNYAIGIIMGFLIPLAFAFASELLSNKVQELSDIGRFTSIPLIGGIGHKKEGGNLQVLSNPRSAITESFRALRSNLSYFVGGQKKSSVFLITSSISGEGKTFTSINLASVLSLSGKKTLLVGADLRRPKLAAEFNVKDSVGLSSFLAGIVTFNDAVQRTSYDYLDVIAGGPIPPNPSELLLGDSFRDFIEKAREAYDYVVIDTAPMSLVTDSYSLFQYADHVIFLVRQKVTPKVLLRQIDEYYTSKKVSKISILFNDLFSGLGSQFSDGYTYTYGYKNYNNNYYN
jgi:capsular exopolysaccharide synthesis family protein